MNYSVWRSMQSILFTGLTIRSDNVRRRRRRTKNSRLILNWNSRVKHTTSSDAVCGVLECYSIVQWFCVKFWLRQLFPSHETILLCDTYREMGTNLFKIWISNWKKKCNTIWHILHTPHTVIHLCRDGHTHTNARDTAILWDSFQCDSHWFEKFFSLRLLAAKMEIFNWDMIDVFFRWVGRSMGGIQGS